MALSQRTLLYLIEGTTKQAATYVLTFHKAFHFPVIVLSMEIMCDACVVLSQHMYIHQISRHKQNIATCIISLLYTNQGNL